MTKEDEREDKNSAWPTWLVPIGFLIPVFAAVSYVFAFKNHVAGGPGDWGTFGDFIGGISNPLLSFLTIILLVASLRLQARELKESTKAVKQSAEELSLTRKIHENQETLQIRDMIRPQLISELEEKVKKAHSSFKSIFSHETCLDDIYIAKGDLSRTEFMKRNRDNPHFLSGLRNEIDKHTPNFISSAENVVNIASALIPIIDTDTGIQNIAFTADSVIKKLTVARIITPQDSKEKFYSPLATAIQNRAASKDFPPLHKTGIDLMRLIENLSA